jgi:hypothetical protein
MWDSVFAFPFQWRKRIKGCLWIALGVLVLHIHHPNLMLCFRWPILDTLHFLSTIQGCPTIGQFMDLVKDAETFM